MLNYCFNVCFLDYYLDKIIFLLFQSQLYFLSLFFMFVYYLLGHCWIF